MRTRLVTFALVAIISLAPAAGCGPSLGAWLYTLKLYPTQTIAAQYTIPKGNLLILVDDDRDLIQPKTARDSLIDELAKLFKEHEVADRVTTNEELSKLRQQEPKFEKRGAREIGQLANADTVLWLNTINFSLNNDLEMTVTPGKFAVMVKVVNAKAEKADEVRLWPTDRDGRLVEVTMSSHDIRQCKSLKEAHEKMAAALADEVAKLFYEQKIKE
jgi:hypothetical protein